MYKSFYGLHSKPFSLLPDSEFLYLGATHRTAYSLLEYGLLTEAPFMVLTGDPGTGKTSLLHKLIADNRDLYSIGFLTNARYDVDYLLPWILLALGLNTKQLDPVEAQHLFANFLAEEALRKRRVVLIMDEAQNLGVKLLEELRLLSNLNRERSLQLQIILSGQPDLQALLRRVDMTQFAQRVVVDFDPRVAEYVRTRRVHPSQEISALPDGGVRLSMAIGDLTEVGTWILGFGETAMVVEPASLRERVGRELENALARYRESPPESARPSKPKPSKTRSRQ